MRKIGLLVLATVLTLAAGKFGSPPVPPTAKRVPNVTEVNGHKLVDNYYWLRDKTNPEVKAYLESENTYTDAVMKPTEPLQKKLYDEMLGRIKETDVEVPYKKGDYFYYTTHGGRQAVPDSLSKERQHGRARRSAAGCERTGEGADLSCRSASSR